MSKQPSRHSAATKNNHSAVFRFITYEESELEREERWLARKLLRRRDNILKATYLATERFLRMRLDESGIDPILEKLGHAAEVSRVYVFKNHSDENDTLLTSQLYEWVAPGIESELQNQNLQNVPFVEAGFQRWVVELGQGQVIYGNVCDFPQTERELLSQQHIISMVVAPIFVGKKWWGFMGFDDCRAVREWSPVEIESLKIATNILGAAIQRKQAEKALLDSERKYRLVVENANEGVVIAQDGMIKFANTKAVEFAGLEDKTAPHLPLVDFIYPDDRQMVVNHQLKRLSGEKTSGICRFRMVSKKGDIIWIQNNGVVIAWEGKPATLNFLMDITERKQAEDALRKIEAQKQAILDASIDWIRHVDKDMRILWCNKTTGEGLQLPPERIIGCTCHELFAGRDDPCEGCPTVKARKTGEIERKVLEIPKCKDFPTEIFWDAYSVPLKNETGEIDSFIQISRNITDQVRAMHALRESEEKYRQLFENESDAVMIFDADTLQFEDANQATLDLFGYTKEEFLALTVVDISTEREKTRNSVKQVIKDQPGSTRVPLRYFQRKDSTAFPGEISAGSFISGNRKKIIGAVRDITDRIRAEEKIHALTHELIKAQENERHRIARYLHDHVAQDLSTLKLGCETLFDDQKEITGKIKDKISELAKLLQNCITAVRDLSYELRPPGMDQLGLIRAVYQYCEDFAEKNDVSVDFYSAGIEDAKLNFDTKINLFRLIQEGLNNIKKHAEAEHVTIRLVASSPSIILRIEDNGKGFDVEGRLARSLKEKRMGLSNMEERVSLLGGSMRIQSRISKGTKIFIEVPYPENTHG